jgi:hypothetical protein
MTDVNPFENLDGALDTDYSADETVKEAESLITKIEDNKKAVEASTDETTIDDKEYLEFELKTLIQSTRRVLDVLEQDVKIGSQPRVFEVFGTLTKTVIDGIKELREMNLSIAQLKLQKEKLDVRKAESKNIPQLPNQVNISLSGRELFNMVSNATKNSQLNEIDAEFEVVDAPKKEGSQ